MRERPILFSAPMVRAIIDGRKSQTRRIVKPQAAILTDELARALDVRPPEKKNQPVIPCRYGQPGDRLWVREAWRIGAWDEGRPAVCIDYCDGPRKEWVDVPDPAGDDGAWFDRVWQQSTDDAGKAGLRTDDEGRYQWDPGQSPCRWRPSIHMPRWASRITLEIVSARVERLQDISDADAKAEGVFEGSGDFSGCYSCGSALSGTTAAECYGRLWESINGTGSWAANPWVWVIEFRRIGDDR